MRVIWKGEVIAPHWSELKQNPGRWWPKVCKHMVELVDKKPCLEYAMDISNEDYEWIQEALKIALPFSSLPQYWDANASVVPTRKDIRTLNNMAAQATRIANTDKMLLRAELGWARIDPIFVDFYDEQDEEAYDPNDDEDDEDDN